MLLSINLCILFNSLQSKKNVYISNADFLSFFFETKVVL